MSVAKVGRGRHSVICLHGWAASGEYWRPAVELLSNGDCAFWLVDLPGFGGSAPLPARGDHLRMLGESVVAMLAERELCGVTVLGHSMGGAVAMHVAAASDRVRALVVEDATNEPPAPEGRAERITELRRNGMTKSVMVEGFAGWYRRLSKQQRKQFVAEGMRADLATLIATQEAIQRGVPDPVVDRLTMPVLMMHGRHDPLRRVEAARRYRDRLPDARLVVLDDASHTPHVDNPNGFAVALANFLTEIISRDNGRVRR